MNWTAALIIVLLCPVIAPAKCVDRKHYFCVSGTFKKAAPKLKKAGTFPKQCSGLFELKGKTTGIVFQDEGPCPAPDTTMIGHITGICQDTGEWTQAEYWFAGRPEFCMMSFEKRMNEARVLAGKIPQGTTRAEVRKILKSYEFIGGGMDSVFSEQYYGHPDVVIEVPFEQPGGNYSSENKVNGTILIKHIELPRP